MIDKFLSYVSDPNRDTYLCARAAIVDSAQYSPYSNDLTDIELAVERNDLVAARRLASESIANLLLSPGFHLLLSKLAKADGNATAEKVELQLAVSCAEGILLTGNGTESSPYLVLRMSDEYDILAFLGLKFAGQALVEKDKRDFDCISVRNGRDLWFDVSDAYQSLQRRMGKRGE